MFLSSKLLSCTSYENHISVSTCRSHINGEIDANFDKCMKNINLSNSHIQNLLSL